MKGVVKMLTFEDMVHIQPKPPDEYSNVSRSGSEAHKSVINGRFKIHKSDDDAWHVSPNS